MGVIVSRRRKPSTDGRILIKIGCTGQRSHQRLVFDTVAVDADLEAGRFSVHHNAVSRGDRVEANVPDPGDLGRVERIASEPDVEFHNHRYVCPICKLDFPMDAATAGEKIFGPIAAAGVSFLDLSDLRSILSK